MASNTISVSDQMRQILDDYSKEVTRAANTSIDKVAKETVSKLKNTSPKKKGDYARSWGLEVQRGPTGINTVIVRNKKHYQLTHLLENGHMIVNKKGTYGRAPAHKHIKPVETWANREFQRLIKEGIER